MLQNLIIYEKTYEMLLWLFPCVNKFPKSQRFVLGQQIETTALEILTGIVRANIERDKRPHLKSISTNLDILRVLLRLAKDLHFISIRQYAFVAEKNNEIGKMLGGWMRGA